MALKLQSGDVLRMASTRLGTLSIILACCVLITTVAEAEDTRKLKAPPTPPPAKDRVDAGLERFCTLAAPAAQEAKIAWQMRQLGELDAKLKQRMDEIEKAAASAREWVSKREAMKKQATDEIVAIIGKMPVEPAALQLAELDESFAAAIIGKLKPGIAGAILGEMDASRAGRLTTILSGVPVNVETP